MRVAVLVLAPLLVLTLPNRAMAPIRSTRTIVAGVVVTAPPATTTATAAPALPVIATTPSTPPTTVPSTTERVRRPIVPEGTVALTFDDGPNETFTPQVLDILARYGVKATFFLVGAEVEQSPDLARRIVAEGHAIGNHTWDHVELTRLDEAGFAAQVDRTQSLLHDLVGVPIPCVRPPRGRINQFVMDQLNARSLRMMKWNRDTQDWKMPGVDSIIGRALEDVRAGRVILMHDSGPDMSQTVAALPSIIEGIQAKGLQISPVCTP